MARILFWLSAGLAVYFIYSFLKGRKPLSPARLNLKAGQKTQKQVLADTDEASIAIKYDDKELESIRLKNLNVMFMYNGHSFDAFEVLGVTPGSNLLQVKQAFEKSLKTSQPDSKLFLQTALRAILEQAKH